jgi:hypothetical protein
MGIIYGLQMKGVRIVQELERYAVLILYYILYNSQSNATKKSNGKQWKSSSWSTVVAFLDWVKKWCSDFFLRTEELCFWMYLWELLVVEMYVLFWSMHLDVVSGDVPDVLVHRNGDGQRAWSTDRSLWLVLGNWKYTCFSSIRPCWNSCTFTPCYVLYFPDKTWINLNICISEDHIKYRTIYQMTYSVKTVALFVFHVFISN